MDQVYDEAASGCSGFTRGLISFALGHLYEHRRGVETLGLNGWAGPVSHSTGSLIHFISDPVKIPASNDLFCLGTEKSDKGRGQ